MAPTLSASTMADGVRCLSAAGLGARDAGSALWQELQCFWNTCSPSATRSCARATPTVSSNPSNAAAQHRRAADLSMDTIIGVRISYQAFISGVAPNGFRSTRGSTMQTRALGLVVVALMVPATAVARDRPVARCRRFRKTSRRFSSVPARTAQSQRWRADVPRDLRGGPALGAFDQAEGRQGRGATGV